MGRQTILIVEDEEDIQQLVSYNLVKAGYAVLCADTGEQGLDLVRQEAPDLVLLDLMLPGVDGLTVCRTIRADAATVDMAIIMLTAKSEEADIVAGLELGADDYITKPFSNKVLLSRVKVVLRRKNRERDRTASGEETPITSGDLTIVPGRHEVTVAGRPVSLTPTEFAILENLVRRAGWVFTRQQIIDLVRGYDYTVTLRSVDVQIFSLRKKLGEWGERIETVRGIGYRVREQAGAEVQQ